MDRRPPHALLLFGLLLLPSALLACAEEPAANRAPRDGGELFLESRCDACHGGQGQGSFTGPTLEALDQKWTPEALARYLRDPLPVIESTPRLSKLRRRFPATMRAYPELPEAERLRLASWLISRFSSDMEQDS